MSPDSVDTSRMDLDRLHAGAAADTPAERRAQHERFFLAALTGYLSSFAGIEKTRYSAQAIAEEAADLADAALALVRFGWQA